MKLKIGQIVKYHDLDSKILRKGVDEIMDVGKTLDLVVTRVFRRNDHPAILGDDLDLGEGEFAGVELTPRGNPVLDKKTGRYATMIGKVDHVFSIEGDCSNELLKHILAPNR